MARAGAVVQRPKAKILENFIPWGTSAGGLQVLIIAGELRGPSRGTGRGPLLKNRSPSRDGLST